VSVRHISTKFQRVSLWTTLCTNAALDWPRDAPFSGEFSFPLRSREADLPAQRATAEAAARFSCAHGDACGSRDSQAQAREGSQAAVRLAYGSENREKQKTPRNISGSSIVNKKHRLSRSRDFDAVYRHGRSASTRFLVLYWFDREDEPGEPRLGLAVPRAAGNAVARNKIKRQLRDVWRARIERIPAGRDYVLIAKPGLPEAVQANGFEWLGARVDEVLGKAAA
jgi:ribonuclease P protein component